MNNEKPGFLQLEKGDYELPGLDSFGLVIRMNQLAQFAQTIQTKRLGKSPGELAGIYDKMKQFDKPLAELERKLKTAKQSNNPDQVVIAKLEGAVQAARLKETREALTKEIEKNKDQVSPEKKEEFDSKIEELTKEINLISFKYQDKDDYEKIVESQQFNPEVAKLELEFAEMKRNLILDIAKSIKEASSKGEMIDLEFLQKKAPQKDIDEFYLRVVNANAAETPFLGTQPRQAQAKA